MTVQLLTGDCRAILPTLPERSIQCCITSPPYHGLRAYGGDAGMIGLEPTIDEHIAALVDVFRGVWRVLRDDGTVWLNYGDAYASNPASGGERLARPQDKQPGTHQRTPDTGWKRPSGLKPKDLIGLPWRIAFALQAEGWYLRSAIVWHKPNPMPESVTDRPTSAYEHIFLLTKSARYYYDAAAIAEPGAEPERQRLDRIGGANGHTVRHSEGGIIGASATRNARNVWTIATQPFSESHFATMPPEIPRRCILAGTSDKGECPACGAPWVRVVEREPRAAYRYPDDSGSRQPGNTPRRGAGDLTPIRCETIGWQPSCPCDAGDPVPQTVLDPFSGAGTTLLVADRLGRNAVGVEVNPEYVRMAQKRITNDAPLFVDLETA